MKRVLFLSVGLALAACAAADNDNGDTQLNSDAEFLGWQAPAGFAGTGPAVAIQKSGHVEVWDVVPYDFDPEVPNTPADRTYDLPAESVDALFVLFSDVDLSALPHSGGVSDCYARLAFRPCADCTPLLLSYTGGQQVTPELDSVWLWFDENLTGESVMPRAFCDLS